MVLKQSIPALISLGLTVTACKEPIVGDWDLVRLGSQPFPLAYEGVTVTFRMEVAEDLDATAAVNVVKSYAGQQYFDSMNYFGDVDVEDKRKEYDIQLQSEEGLLILACDIDKDGEELECKNETPAGVLDAGVGTPWVFEKD